MSAVCPAGTGMLRKASHSVLQLTLRSSRTAGVEAVAAAEQCVFVNPAAVVQPCAALHVASTRSTWSECCARQELSFTSSACCAHQKTSFTASVIPATSWRQHSTAVGVGHAAHAQCRCLYTERMVAPARRHIQIGFMP